MIARGRVKQLLPVLASPVVLELVADHADHDVVRDEPAGVHDLLSFYAERRLLRHLLAEHVARREVAHAKLVAYPRRLRALACSLRCDNPRPQKQASEQRVGLVSGRQQRGGCERAYARVDAQANVVVYVYMMCTHLRLGVRRGWYGVAALAASLAPSLSRAL
jgi:hypothetical protein